MTDANQSDAVVVPEGWIKHDGGPCPVDAEALVKLWFEQEALAKAEGSHWDRAGAYSWRHRRGKPRIIAYKPEPSAGGEKG